MSRNTIRGRKQTSQNLRRTLCFESLENRRLLATISGQEMEFVYDLNYARHDPAAYDDAIGHPGLLDGVAAKQPLAINDQLVESAEYHSNDMATNNYFAHTSPSGLQPNEMIRNAGYDLHSTFPNDGNYVESLAAGTFYTSASYVLKELVYDLNVDPPGHRYHLLAMGPSESFWDKHTEIGVGWVSNASAYYRNYWTVHTAYRNDTSLRFLTGVVYEDANSNSRYDAGEGLAGVTVDVDGPLGPTTATTNAAGGWSLSVTNGEYDVSVSGNGYVGFSSTVATVSGSNVQVDFIQGIDDGFVNFTQTPGGGPGIVSVIEDVVAYNAQTGQWRVATSGDGEVLISDFAQWGAHHNWANIKAGDWDGDGDMDIAAQLASGRWYVGLNDGAGAFTAVPAWSWSNSIERLDIRVGDFDGDGSDDIVHRSGGGHWYVSHFDGASFGTDYWATWGANNGWVDTVVGDFTGDGRDDIASRASWGRWFVAVSEGTSFATTSWASWSTGIGRNNVMAGDFNADGRDDIVHQTDAGHWYVSQSDGTSFTNLYFGFWSPGVERLDLQAADMNGDGRMDIIARTSGGHWYVAESNGSSFTTDYYGNWTGVWQFAVAGDYNGDGVMDMAGLRSDGAWRVATSDGDSFLSDIWADWGAGDFGDAWSGDFN